MPSVEERVEKWIKGYGFRPIEDPLRQEMRSMNLLIFPATVILEKNLVSQSNRPLIPNPGVSRRPLLDLNLPPPNVQDNDTL
ncbi:hypothetical protein FRX31_033383 [Thalictrum thalictroides]|uniref:Uncharacterized protein n=1 Tax=Thalictrum thalictroides TaxID=46969 RepID=A0A7J6UXV3_THATH|nr:hypothetical protein FRX31_033383 [Thalictrum thalictroides]